MTISDPSKTKELEETMNIIKSYFFNELSSYLSSFFSFFI